MQVVPHVVAALGQVQDEAHGAGIEVVATQVCVPDLVPLVGPRCPITLSQSCRNHPKVGPNTWIQDEKG